MANTEPKRAPRADAARNIERLLVAAKELFDERDSEVALDDVAHRAGVGNATLYRHFPTRADLLVAVYAEEVEALRQRGAELLESPEPAAALFDWLDGFVVHVSTKRSLALAATEDSDARRTELFEGWHRSMRTTARKLLTRAKDAGVVRSDLSVNDLLGLANAVAIASPTTRRARRLLRAVRHGVDAPTAVARSPGSSRAGWRPRGGADRGSEERE